MKIAVVLFAYKRPRYLRKAIKTHTKVEGLDYHAFIDYSEMQTKILEIITEAGIYKYLYTLNKNLGLNENIKRGITHLFNIGYEGVIVLEDDLILQKDSIEYLRAMLEWTKNNKNFGAVSCSKGRHKDPNFRCWAWGTWADRWYEIDWSLKPDKKNRDSWDMIVAENFKVKGWFCRCSQILRVKHIGWSGVHYNQLDRFSIRRLWKLLVS